MSSTNRGSWKAWAGTGQLSKKQHGLQLDCNWKQLERRWMPP